MKKLLFNLMLTGSLLFILLKDAGAQNIGINATGATPAASAMLDVSAIDKGLLIPRVALTATNSASPVTAPTTSLLVYNTATAGISPNDVAPGYYYWSGSAWIGLLSSASSLNAWNSLGNSGTNAATNFIGTTDNVDLVVKTNSNEKVRFTSAGNVGIGNNSPSYKFDVNGPIRTGKGSNTTGSLVFSNSTNDNTITLSSGISTTPYTLTLPTTQGAANTMLTNNGSGGLSWTTAATAGAWSATGNSGTSSSTNFLGTTDNQALSFRVNNLPSGKIETSSTANTAIGYQSGQSNTGTANTSFGSQTLLANTSGINNTAVGSSSLKGNLTGNGNTGVGASTLLLNTGSSNTAVGTFAMQSNAGGNNNAALGNSALSNNTSGTGNTAVGSAALQSNVSGINNTAIGNGSFQLSTQGNSNTSVGAFALQNNNLGGSNSGLGYGALGATVAGNNNTGLGYQAGITNTSGGNNTFVGYLADATLNNLTNATAIGYNAKVASSNSLVLGGTGANTVNVAIGNNAFDGTNPEKLLIDAGTTTSVNAVYAKGSINNYLQFNIQNLSAGAQSSSDLVATANNGTETTNFVDLGINGSGYSYQSGNPIETGKPNDGYLISSGNDFYVVNNNASKDMLFLTGGTAAANERMRILSSGNVGIGTSTPGNKLEINSGIGGASGLRLKQMPAGAVLFMSSTADVAQNNNNFFFDATNYRLGIASGAAPNSTLQVGGSISLGVVTKSANYTASVSDHTILCNNTSGSITISLPPAAGASGRVYVIKKISGILNNVVIDGNLSETIDGATTATLSIQYNSVMIQSDGSNWFILSNN